MRFAELPEAIQAFHRKDNVVSVRVTPTDTRETYTVKVKSVTTHYIFTWRFNKKWDYVKRFAGI